jgi:hypothetical protein
LNLQLVNGESCGFIFQHAETQASSSIDFSPPPLECILYTVC